ncbi:MAG: hypothetical protein Q9164_006345, partial [Protoblastenia rupestris]
MADIDEDIIFSTNVNPEANEISDETQDFRFLTSLSQYAPPYRTSPFVLLTGYQFRTSDHPTLPRRGEKDFESHGTRSQEDVLFTSRQAMHDALSYPRLHKPNGLTGLLNPEDGSCVIEEPKGPNMQNLGVNDSQGRLHLLPEEALYLVERGSLNVEWQNGELRGMPLSLQATYAHLVGSEDLTLERYTVYAGLKRSGYIVQRAPTWHSKDHGKILLPPQSSPLIPHPNVFDRLYAFLFPPIPVPDPPPLGPLVGPGLYRSYAPIYRRLALIPFHDPSDLAPSLSPPPYHP